MGELLYGRIARDGGVMAVSPNINFGLPPLQSPIIAGGGSVAGLPFQSRPERPLMAGNLHPAWFGWFNQISKLVGQLPTISDVAAAMVPVGGGALPTDWTPDAWQRFIYYQTDTGLLYISMIVSNVWTWVYLAGTVTVANPASLPSGLGPAETNLIAYELTYFHSYRWTGSAWTFAPGDPGAKYIVATPTAAPKGGKWQLCDGTAVQVSNGDGTTSSVTTPNLMTSGNSGGPSLLGAGAPLGFNASTPGSWQAAARTETESAHTHNVTASIVVQSGTGSTAAATGATGAGTAHSHVLNDTNALLKAPSDSTDATHGGGMPDRFYLQWYMRQ